MPAVLISNRLLETAGGERVVFLNPGDRSVLSVHAGDKSMVGQVENVLFDDQGRRGG